MKKFLVILFLLPAISSCTQNIEVAILKELNVNRDKQFDNTFRVITNSAPIVAYTIPILLLGISLAIKDKILKNKSLYLVATTFSSGIISSVIKYSYAKPRPYEIYSFIEKLTDGGGSSFPSGHTSDAIAIAVALSIVFPKWYIIIPIFTWAVAVGYSRIDLGVHYPSDVLMGAIIGAGSAYLCYKSQQWLHKKRK